MLIYQYHQIIIYNMLKAEKDVLYKTFHIRCHRWGARIIYRQALVVPLAEYVTGRLISAGVGAPSELSIILTAVSAICRMG